MTPNEIRAQLQYAASLIDATVLEVEKEIVQDRGTSNVIIIMAGGCVQEILLDDETVRPIVVDYDVRDESNEQFPSISRLSDGSSADVFIAPYKVPFGDEDNYKFYREILGILKERAEAFSEADGHSVVTISMSSHL